jgi:hypothetical protein
MIGRSAMSLMHRNCVTACLLIALLFVQAATALGGELLHPNSLVGWTYGPGDTRGWRVNDGVLSGDSPEHPLVAGWTFGDFELTGRWTTRPGASWQLTLPTRDKSTTLKPLVLTSADDATHSLRVSRRDGKLTWSIDDRQLGEQPVANDIRLGLQLALTGGAGTLRQLQVTEPAGKPLFNGKDLTGWWTPGKLESWPVIDGMLVCINQNGNYLRTEEEFGNFTLSLEYRIAKGGNSGIGLRTPRAGWPSGDGMELQIMDEKPGTPITRHSTASIYGNLEPLGRADRSEDWNHAVVKAEGRMISEWINGQLVQHVNTGELPELKHRHLKGWIGLQDHGNRIEFRNLTILTAPDGLGPAEWYRSRPRTGSQLLTERYMNPVTLATNDGLRTNTLVRRIGGDGEQTVAELTGPGALVELMRNGDSGRMAFYVDGAEQPAIECAANELDKHITSITGERRPLLVYLPYRQSLKITLRDAKPTRFRLDYVTFDPSVQVETLSGIETTATRGLLPALTYRFQQGGWGGHREHDPYPRQTSNNTTLKPGESRSLVKLDGAGVVQWTHLLMPPKKITNDDLWLEVTVDGEPQPSIAAPVRYWYPGLAEGKKYQNFVVTDHGGPTNYLAIPYARGITLALRNRGKATIKDARLSVSYAPHDSSTGKMPLNQRLRGVFQPADEQPLVSLSGAGRLVGLVYADEVSPLLVAKSLLIDESHVSLKDCPNLRFLLGLGEKSTDEAHGLCGVRNGLAWRWWLPAPLDFQKGLTLGLDAEQRSPNRLVVYYAASK